MKKIKVDKLECQYSALFKIMWISTIVWVVFSVANYFGHWLIPSKLDDVGMSIFFLFGLSILLCFGKAVLDLVSQHRIINIGNKTKKIASFVFMSSFIVMLVSFIWRICGTKESHIDFTRNGTSLAIPYETIISIVQILIIAAILSTIAVFMYWYVKMFIFLFKGRIKRIGI